MTMVALIDKDDAPAPKNMSQRCILNIAPYFRFALCTAVLACLEVSIGLGTRCAHDGNSAAENVLPFKIMQGASKYASADQSPA